VATTAAASPLAGSLAGSLTAVECRQPAAAVVVGSLLPVAR